MSKFKSLQRLNEPWLISQDRYSAIKETIDGLDANIDLDAIEPVGLHNINGIGLITLKGTMMKNPTALEQAFLDATCTQAFEQQCDEALADDQILGVLLDLDSGGGSVQGVMEASESVRKLHKEKPVIAFSEGLICSACYWLASQSTSIVASPSARIGSIGVYIPHADYSEAYEKQGIKVEVITNKEGVHKGAGLEGTSLTDVQRDQIKAEVDEIFGLFKSSINQARKVDDNAMQGQAFLAQRAKEKGLVDYIGSFADAINLLSFEIKNR